MKSFREFLGRYSQSLTRWLLHARDRHDHQTKEPELHHPKGLTPFDRLWVMAPARAGALIQVFTHQLRRECTGCDFLYLHFAGDPLTFGFLVCALTSGGLMAGWQHS